MAAVRVRPADAADLSALRHCDEYAHRSPERSASIERAIRKGQCLVAAVDSRLAGFVVLTHEFFEQGFVSLVVVAREFRRRGVGSVLVRAAEAECRTEKLFSSTNASNLAAQALLEKAGFVRSGVVENLDVADPEFIYFKVRQEHER